MHHPATVSLPGAAAPATTGSQELVARTLAALSIEPVTVMDIPARPGVTAAWPQWVAPTVRVAVERVGVRQLWRHQVEAATSAWQGRDVVLATGTASGKSVAYWLPALTAATTDHGTTIYCTPPRRWPRISRPAWTSSLCRA